MDVSAAFVADGETPKRVNPGQGALHHPSVLSEALAGFNTPAGNASLDAAPAQKSAAAAVVIGFVRVELPGPAPRSPTRAADRWKSIDHLLKERAVVLVRPREFRRQGDAGALDHNVPLRARLAAVRGVRPRKLAPLLPGHSRYREQPGSSRSGLSPRASRAAPSGCVSRRPAPATPLSLRQQVIPEPQPISFGSNSPGRPLRSTKRMPVRTALLGMRFRPPLGRGGSGGNSRSNAAQRSSSSKGFAIPAQTANQPVLLDALRV